MTGCSVQGRFIHEGRALSAQVRFPDRRWSALFPVWRWLNRFHEDTYIMIHKPRETAPNGPTPTDALNLDNLLLDPPPYKNPKRIARTPAN